MKIKAIVPVKKHSERVPGKNRKLFCGAPLCHAIIKTLESCPLVEEIIVNTDCEETASDLPENFSKVNILKRPECLLGDMVTANSLIAHDLSKVDGNHFVQTHCTNPLLTLSTLTRAIQSYFLSLYSYDSLYSVTKIQSRLFRADNSPINHDTANLLRTQDLEPVFMENACFFIFSRQSFRNASNNRIGLKPQQFLINKIEAIDIDYPEDFVLAEIIYENRKRFREIFES